LVAWREAWRRYQVEVPKLPGVATIYRSDNRSQNADANSTHGAMAELCESSLATLDGKTSN